VADTADKTDDAQTADSKSRRRLLRIGAATAIGGLVLTRALIDLADTNAGAVASTLPTCRGCTGCAVVCPTGAISISAGGIAIEQAACIRCGFCVAVCPVAGVMVHREDSRG